MSEFNLEITVQELDNLDTDPYELIDIREAWEKSIADIGGILIPLNTLPSIENKLDFKSRRLILYCHHGANYLRSKGFLSVQSLQGGIDLWAREIDREIPTY
jgi:rhodanese-related sulfurtransferase